MRNFHGCKSAKTAYVEIKGPAFDSSQGETERKLVCGMNFGAGLCWLVFVILRGSFCVRDLDTVVPKYVQQGFLLIISLFSVYSRGGALFAYRESFVIWPGNDYSCQLLWKRWLACMSGPKHCERWFSFFFVPFFPYFFWVWQLMLIMR